MKVKYLPKKSIDVTICDIYEDRDAVVCQHSDTLRDDCTYNVEALGFKFGLKPLAFIWSYNGLASDLKSLYDTGVMKFGQYIPTDRYRDANSAGTLPDYATTTVSTQGAAFYGKTAGESKPGGYPNQGQDLFNYTNGARGYDVVNGVAGADGNSGYLNELDFQRNWFKSVFGKFPSVGADRQGQTGSSEIYMPYYLGIRDTAPNGNTSYGTSKNGGFLGSPGVAEDRLLMMQKLLTTRWENGMRGLIPIANANQSVLTGINNAFANKGMFNDFLHWYWSISHGGDVFWLHRLYELINTSVNGRNAWYCGVDQAFEYLWFRRMVKRVRGSIIDNKLHLIADFDDDFFNDQIAGMPKKLVYELIKQPLSVKIDLSGTYFAGKNIKSNYGKVISLGSNKYIVDIPFQANGNDFKRVEISETTISNYKNLNKPTVLSYSGGIITTDIPVKAVLFSGDFTETMSVKQRSLTLSKTHTLNVDSASKYIGIISEDNQTILFQI